MLDIFESNSFVSVLIWSVWCLNARTSSVLACSDWQSTSQYSSSILPDSNELSLATLLRSSSRPCVGLRWASGLFCVFNSSQGDCSHIEDYLIYIIHYIVTYIGTICKKLKILLLFFYIFLISFKFFIKFL